MANEAREAEIYRVAEGYAARHGVDLHNCFLKYVEDDRLSVVLIFTQEANPEYMSIEFVTDPGEFAFETDNAKMNEAIAAFAATKH